ncbi:MAG: hypothetical protein B6241_06450 [Spirochaetaceae bacterium 4572_59]|nr:MAG: hypothetical protein B6241_06450 [Spirochaetaceae bacterium 4572_59]
MTRKCVSLILLMILIRITTAWAATPEFSIRYYDKKIYYPESPIQIKVILSNPDSKPISFKIAENRTFNFLFTLKTLKNESLSPSRDYLINYNSNDPAYYRMVTLEPGEEFGFILDLGSFVNVNDAGVYILEGEFFSDLNNKSTNGIESNKLSLTIRPGMYASTYSEEIDQETGDILNMENLPPDEVVEYMLRGRQKNQWNKFFLYIDMKDILLQNDMIRRQFEKMSEEEQHIALDKYKEELQSGRMPENQSIVEIPQEFDILQTSYNSHEATVIVREVFQNIGFREIKKYTYYLHRYDNIWKINRYEVKNVGTE